MMARRLAHLVGLTSRRCLIQPESSLLSTVMGCSNARSYANRSPQQPLSQATDTSSLLTELSTLCHKPELSGKSVSDITEQLAQCQYQTLSGHMDWLQDNRHIAYIQLLLQEKLSSAMKPVVGHTGFMALCESVTDTVEQLADEECTKLLLNLLYLGLNHHHPAVYKLLVHCRTRIPHFGVKSLHDMSYITRTFNGHDPITLKSIMSRHMELVSSEESTCWTPDELVDECDLAVNVLRFLSVSTCEMVTERLAQLIEDPAYLNDINYLGSYMRMAQIIFMKNSGSKFVPRNIIYKTSLACYPLMKTIQANHVAEICSALKKGRCYEPNIASLFERRAVELLPTATRLCDISNLMYAFSKSTSTSIIREVENALYPKLLQGDVDLVVLSNLADSLSFMGCKNRDVILRYQQLVVENADNLIKYSSRYQRVVKYLVRRPFIEPHMAVSFSEKLLKKLKEEEGLHIYSVSSMASFLLPNSHNALPDVLYEQLLQAIPKWKEQELYRFSLGLNNMKQPLTGQMRRQVSNLQACLHTNLSNQLDRVDTLDYLYQLCLGLVVHNRQRDPTLTEKMMEMFAHFTGNLTDVAMSKVCQVFMYMSYHSPQVYRDITHFILGNHHNIEQLRILDAVKMFAQVGYQPEDASAFLEKMNIESNRFVSSQKVKYCLVLLNNLAIIQVFPEEALAEIFTLDFIEKVDAQMEEKPSLRRELERLIMILNRSVVLECPQLNVPWFHEEYVQQTHHTEKPSLDGRFTDEVENALDDIVGEGPEMYRRWTTSSYGHTINFECLLDEHGKPVSLTLLDQEPDTQTQRVAVLCLRENDYCYNSRNPLGSHQQKIRQLQIMGYKVVEVPYYSWYSMGLSEWGAKVDFLQTQLLC